MHADTAMYKAKEQGGSSYQAYSRAMNASALQRLTLENALRRAIEREEFELHYQPIVDARTGAADRAPRRWCAGGIPSWACCCPSEFIPLAEENGLDRAARRMGAANEACGQNRAWQGAGLPPIRVVVNLSSRQLRRSLPDTVSGVLQRTGLEARFLGLELTESLLVKHQREDMDTLHALRAMGLHLAVDDFGTGYSSFSYLKHLPLDALKIDRSFVREITTSPDDAAITTAIIAMAHALGSQGGGRRDRDGGAAGRAAASRDATRCRDTCSAGRSPPDQLAQLLAQDAGASSRGGCGRRSAVPCVAADGGTSPPQDRLTLSPTPPLPAPIRPPRQGIPAGRTDSKHASVSSGPRRAVRPA